MRETYVLRDGQLVPKSTAAPLTSNGAFFMPDIKPFTTQDGVEITSRSSLRAYEQANGVKQVGNDYASLHQKLRQQVRGE
jgi:hypothetical protein